MMKSTALKKRNRQTSNGLGENQIKVGLALTPTAQKILRRKSVELQMSQCKIFEILVRSLLTTTHRTAFLEYKSQCSHDSNDLLHEAENLTR